MGFNLQWNFGRAICDQGYIYLNFSFNIFEIIKLLESVEGTSFLMHYPFNLSVIIVF